MVRAAGMRGRADVGVGELALDARALATVGGAVDEERVLELGGEADHELDRNPLARLVRGEPCDRLARVFAVEARDDRPELERQDDVRARDALRIAQHQRAAETPVGNDDRLDGPKTRSR